MNTKAGHQVIRIRHTLKALKNDGLVDDGHNLPEDAVKDMTVGVLRTAESFYQIGIRRVTVVAPTALTPEDRIATLVEAALQSWQKHHSQYIALFLLPFESGPTIARIDYAPESRFQNVSDDGARGKPSRRSDGMRHEVTGHPIVSYTWFDSRFKTNNVV